MSSKKLEFSNWKDYKEKTVIKSGATAGIYLPKEWLGKKVAVILLE